MSFAAILRPNDLVCRRCSTPGITYLHTPEECDRDWQHREITTRILTAEEALEKWT